MDSIITSPGDNLALRIGPIRLRLKLQPRKQIMARFNKMAGLDETQPFVIELTGVTSGAREAARWRWR